MKKFDINPYLIKSHDSPFGVQDPEKMKGQWSSLFKNNSGIFLDLGCGNGTYTYGMANQNPEYNFIGVDLAVKYLYKALRKAEIGELANVRYAVFDAQSIEDYFEDSELEGIYLLFSDPYKKKKHMKKRVVNQKFLAQISKVLKKDRYFVIKTDHPEYYEEIAKEIEQTPHFEQVHFCDDFKDSEYAFSDVKTHYELKFSFRGIRHTVLKNIKTPS